MTAAGLLRELVRIPSVNPDGNPGVAPDLTGEQRCAEFVGAVLRDLGASVTIDPVLPGRPNVVARFPSSRPNAPRLLLAPHTDTVSVVGMSIDPFAAEERDGKIWGRGASDTKGPMAAMLCALAACRDDLPGLSHEIWFAGLMGEEAGNLGAHALAARERFDFVIAGEPTALQTVHAHKGSAWVDLHTSGRAVHASTPEEGDNAIDRMVDALAALRRDLTADFSRQSHPLLGHPTFNVGTIRGGSKVNIVPDSCEACVDIRTIPGQDIEATLARFAKKFPALRLETKTNVSLDTDPKHPLVAALSAAGAAPAGAPWLCDAAIFAAAGTPAVAVGPGSIAQAHTADEFIAINDLDTGVDFFTRFFRSLKK